LVKVDVIAVKQSGEKRRATCTAAPYTLFAKEKKAQTSVTPQFPTNDVNTLFVCRGEQCSPVDLTFLQKKKGRKFDFPSL